MFSRRYLNDRMPVRAFGESSRSEIPIIQTHFSAEEVDAALCAQVDSELFYPEKGKRDSATEAVKICEQCPVKDRCLEIALNRDERYGIWGGTTPRERRKMRKHASL